MYWPHSPEVLIVGSGVRSEVGEVARQFGRAGEILSVDEGVRGKHLSVAGASVHHGDQGAPGGEEGG